MKIDAVKTCLDMSPEMRARLSSPYIPDGIRQDVWQICKLSVKDRLVEAKVSFRSAFHSPSDLGGAHLTPFSANEIVSQIMVIYLHWFAGYEQKCREVWLREVNVRCVKTIRDLAEIDFKMKRVKTRRLGAKTYAEAHWVVSGKCGGHFEVMIKGFME